MVAAANIAALVGNTPLIRLRGPSAATGCEILAKCEFTNPGGSIKDRAAKFIIEDAEASGALRPGGTLVEGTAGNTGIGLALLGSARGYRTIIVIPDTQSAEKKATLRALGAELVEVPPASYSNPAHYVHQSRRIAEETPGALWSDQFDNIANRRAHIQTTAAEIWTQTGGRIDGFTCAVGTGGTLAGVGLGLKEHDPRITIALTDPHGAALYDYYAYGELRAEGSSVAEGIGQSRITANLESAPIDTQFRISDEEGLKQVYALLREEGLCLGLSSGINVAGAMALARQLGRGSTVVTILCDSGMRYLSTIYDRAWLASKGLAGIVDGRLTAVHKRTDRPYVRMMASEPPLAPSPAASQSHRVRVGMIGLASVFLLVMLATAILSLGRPADSADANQAAAVNATEPPREPPRRTRRRAG